MTRRVRPPRPSNASPPAAATPAWHSRFSPGQRIHGNIDGDGYRRYTVVRVGREWITLLDTFLVSAVQIRREEIETNRRVMIADSDPVTVLELLARNLIERNSRNARVSGEVALEAIAILETMI